MTNLLYKAMNLVVAGTFAAVAAFACYDQGSEVLGSLDDVTLAASGVLVFISFVVLAWFTIDANSRKVV